MDELNLDPFLQAMELEEVDGDWSVPPADLVIVQSVESLDVYVGVNTHEADSVPTWYSLVSLIASDNLGGDLRRMELSIPAVVLEPLVRAALVALEFMRSTSPAEACMQRGGQ